MARENRHAPRGLVLQQQRDAPPALLDDWGRERGLALDVVRADLEPALPAPQRFHFAVALGSDERADDLSVSWIPRELEWLRCADQAGLPVLGICFGAQALAVALGGAVRTAPVPEIGWVTVQTDAPALVAPGPWFTWHGDLIDLPERAVEIARNAAGVQAFTTGAHLGVQFHPEVTAAVVEAWASTDGGARQLALAAKGPSRLTVDGAPTPGAARIAAFGLLDAFLARVR